MMGKFELMKIAEKAFEEMEEKDRISVVRYLVTTFKIDLSEFVSSDQDKNTISYSNEEGNVKFESSFNDEIGEKVAESILGMTNATPFSSKRLESPSQMEVVNAEPVQDAVEVDTLIPATIEKVNDIPTLEILAKKGVVKFESEWLLIFAFYASRGGEESFNLDKIKEQYYKQFGGKNFGYNYGRLVKKEWITDFGGGIHLTDAGKNDALKIFGRSAEPSDVGKRNNSGGKSSRKSKSIFVIDRNLDLKGANGAKSLKDFVDSYEEIKPETHFIVLVVAYLNRVLNLEGATKVQVFTCYKEIGRRVPERLNEMVNKCSGNEYGFLTRDGKEYVLSTKGENFVDHDLKRIGQG